jgi:hypothetical protein
VVVRIDSSEFNGSLLNARLKTRSVEVVNCEKGAKTTCHMTNSFAFYPHPLAAVELNASDI